MKIQTRFVTGSNRFYRKKKANMGVGIHWTANTSRGAGARAHYNYCNRKGVKNPKDGKLYENSSFSRKFVYGLAHYYVDDTDAMLFCPTNEYVPALGSSKGYYEKKKELYPNASPNYYATNIEFCVNPDSDPYQTLENVCWLAADELRKQNCHPSIWLFRHWDITHKNCPAFMLDEYSWSRSGIKHIPFMDWDMVQAVVTYYYDHPEIVKPLVVSKGYSVREQVIPTLSKKTRPVKKQPVQTTTKSRILKVQKAMNKLGFTDFEGKELVVDGYSGSRTESAIQKFQVAMRNKKTGYWGNTDEKAYNEIMKRPLLYRKMRVLYPYAVKYVQHRLGITADGMFGPGTEKAVKQYQISKGLKADGYVGSQTWPTFL